MRLRRSPAPTRSRGRRVANTIAALFLLGVIVLVGVSVWQVFNPDYEEYDTDILRRDLEEFAGPVDDPDSMVEVQPCTGEGSVPAAAQRSYSVPGTIATVSEDLAAEAAALGWAPTPPPGGLTATPDRLTFEKGDRELFVSLALVHGSLVEVELGLTGGDAC